MKMYWYGSNLWKRNFSNKKKLVKRDDFVKSYQTKEEIWNDVFHGNPNIIINNDINDDHNVWNEDETQASLLKIFGLQTILYISFPTSDDRQ